ncbi:MAG: glycosyltransferase family 4 protein [Alkalilacustris sp.]
MGGPASGLTKERRLRVLAVAEAANPEWVSVPLVGWSLVEALRRQADVHLVTQVRNRPALLRAGLREGDDFTAIDNEHIARPVHRATQLLRLGKGKGWTIGTALAGRLAYPQFERMVWHAFRARLEQGQFDVVHRITPLTPTANSSLAPRCARLGIPFILGPLNGGVPWPPGFDRERRREREWLSYVRGVYRLSFARRRMLDASRVLIAASDHTASELPARHRGKLARIPENGIDPGRFTARAQPRLTAPLRGCFIGRLVPYKGPDMLIEAALPHLRAGRLHLDIVGSGPLEGTLHRMVAEAGVGASVTFHGWLPHAEIHTVLARADIMPFPSVREFGGGVVLEAMATGVVPVVCDYAGPGELVDDDTGYKVALGTRPQVVEGFRARLHALLDDPSDLARRSENGLRRIAETFTWDRKASQILDLYRWALAPTGPIPHANGPAPLSRHRQGD